MRITSAGYVGIGDTAPDAPLYVNGSAYSSGYGGLRVVGAGSGAGSTNADIIADFGIGTSGTVSGVWLGGRTDETTGIIGSKTASGNIAFEVYQSGWKERMRITNAGNVGIGTDSPAQILEVNPGTAADPIIQITNSNAAAYRPSLRLDNQATGGRSYRMFSTSGSDGVYGGGKFAIYDDDAGAGRLTIDSSGNLMVGKTAINTAGNGGELRANGQLLAIATDINPFFGARLNSDGDLIVFRKDTTTVGNIGTYGGDLSIGTGDTGLRFIDANDAIYPFDTSTGLLRGSAIELGDPNYRFKNLHLSGGINFGNTGGSVTSRLLDDYEEGTFNCSIHDGATTPTQTQYGYYTKIGNVCHIYGQTTIQGASSNGSILRISLPFSTPSVARGGIAVGLNQPIAVSGNDIDLHLVVELNTNVIYIVSTDPAGGHTHLTFNNLGYGIFSFGGTYTVA